MTARRWLRPGSQTRKDRHGAPDERLLEYVADPFESVGDTEDSLRAAERHLRDRSDRRAVFLTVYAEMTSRVEAGIEAGLFEDAEWVRSYLVSFANRYRRVLVDFERGNEVPVPWAIGFSGSTRGETVFLQDALLGINAHINYDLPYSLRAVGIDPARLAKRRDHRRINEVLEQLIDVVQRSLAMVYGAEGYRDIDQVLGGLDEQLTIIGLREARELAWLNATRLVDSSWSLFRQVIDWRIGVVATGAAGFILAPSIDPDVLALLRDIERDGPTVGEFLETFKSKTAEATIGIE